MIVYRDEVYFWTFFSVGHGNAQDLAKDAGKIYTCMEHPNAEGDDTVYDMGGKPVCNITDLQER